MNSSHYPAELYQQALKLSAGDRAVLAGLFLDSLDASTEDNVDEAWRAEIERRMHELDTGAVTHWHAALLCALNSSLNDVTR